MKLLFFDTETTDIKPGNICQLSYILVDNSTKPQTTIGKNFFFTVEDMSASAEDIHGFSLENLYELSNGQYFEDQLENFIHDFLNSDIVIGHNVNFDLKFLNHELEFCDIGFNPNNVFCTMSYYKDVCKMTNGRGGIKNPRLEEVVTFLQLTQDEIKTKCNELFNGVGNYHDARFDTTATYLIVTNGIKKGLIPKGYFSQMTNKLNK
ncbi:3'-5' exonuclease [Clostridium sp.]|uniref:3'-5' exonuclease n=1 Tax=Clostridium sp. TaxID=1506 RepID=UPI002FC93DA9